MTWHLDPVAVTLFGVTIRWYGLLFAGGLLLAARLGTPLVRAAGLSNDEVERLFGWIVAGVVIGARLGHVLFYEPARYFADPVSILEIWHGGLASHGGVLGILAAIVIFARRRRIPVLPLLDAVAVVAPFAGAAIRLGNFANSEVIGRPSTVPWAVTFSRVDLVPRHPTQLYEALAYTLIGVGLWRAARSGATARPGWLLGWSLLLIFTVRFLLEFLKEPQVATEAGLPLDFGQLLSLPALLAAGAILLWSRRRRTEVELGKAVRRSDPEAGQPRSPT
jgi:prolipoprotein diacylglyceryl transferase